MEREDDPAATIPAAVTLSANSEIGIEGGAAEERRQSPAALRQRYDDLRQIGEGAMGTVFRGWDPRIGRAVAIKLLKSSEPEDTRRFLQEARAQARVQHENVCRVYEAGEADGDPFIVMEFIDGEPLDRAQAKMSLEQKVKVVREVAAALHEAHRLGLVHRDIKPSNIIITTTEDHTLKPFVVDFGLAREVSSDGQLSSAGVVVGTPSYMSPEQAMGDSQSLDRRTDVYSLGATLFELIAGRTPFVGANSILVLTQVMLDDAPSLSSVRRGVSPDLETIVMTCLERDPARRYESARALGEDLQRFLDGEPIQAKRASLAYVLRVKARKNKGAVAAAIVALCVAIVVGVMWVNAARKASAQASLARELGEDVKYVELFLRSAYGLPVHDIEREQRVVSKRLATIQQRMDQAGEAGQGPGHYALGRGHLALHEYEQAQNHLESAIANGYTKPEVQYALGLVLGERYTAAIDRSRSIQDPKARQAAVVAAEETYREPALRHLRASGGTEVESKTYIEGLVAFYEKRYGDALIKSHAAAEESPWLYEAKKLEGDALISSGLVANEKEHRQDARKLFEQAVEAYTTAAAIATSDAAVHEALAEAWLQILVLDQWSSGAYRASIDAAMAACNNAIRANGRSANAYTKKSRALYHAGDYLVRNGKDPRPKFNQAISSATKAKQLSSNDPMVADSIGNALSYIAKYERKIGVNPIPSLERALKSFDDATRILPSFVWAWNDAGVALQVRAEYEIDHGIDPRSTIDQAVARYERAVVEDPKYVGSSSNMAFVLLIRANYELSVGHDARPDTKRAVEVCERDLAMDPKWLPALNNRGWAELAGAQYEERIGEDPTASLDRAQKSFQASLDINADEADTQFGMGTVKHVRARHLLRLERDAESTLKEAKTALERASALDQNEPAIRLERGQLALTLARHAKSKDDTTPLLDEAVKAFEEGLRINARSAPLHAAFAEVSAMRAKAALEHHQNAETHIKAGLAAVEKSLEQNPQWALAHANKGWLYALRAHEHAGLSRIDDARQAIEALEKAFKINPLLPKRYKEMLANLRGDGETKPASATAKK